MRHVIYGIPLQNQRFYTMPSQVFCMKYTEFLHEEFYASAHISPKCSHNIVIISNYHPIYDIFFFVLTALDKEGQTG